MNKSVNCIMFVDDNRDDNFFHERIIKKNAAAKYVIIKESAKDGLNYLKEKNIKTYVHPDIIFLDINMPGMNGWEFLEEYKKLEKELQSMIVVMLSTSDNPDDLAKARQDSIEFRTKPLTKEMLESIISEYFSNGSRETAFT